MYVFTYSSSIHCSDHSCCFRVFHIAKKFWTRYRDATHRPPASAQKLRGGKWIHPIVFIPWGSNLISKACTGIWILPPVLSLCLGSRGEEEESGLEIHFLRAGNALPAPAAQRGLQSHSWHHSTEHNPFSQIWYRRELSLGLSYHSMLYHGCLFGVSKSSSWDCVMTSEKCCLITKGRNQYFRALLSKITHL